MGAGPLVRGIAAEPGKDGRVTFMTKGQLVDGRVIALRLADDGSLLEKRTEISTDTVPPQVQQIVNENFGDFVISHAMETTGTGQPSYDLTAKRPDAAVEITVRADGSIVGYSAKFRQPEN